MRRISGWMNARPGQVVAVTVAITALLTVPFLTMAPTQSASTEPEGPVFDARDLIAERFVSSVIPTFFIVEDPAGDLLRADALRALLGAENVLRADPKLGPTLFDYFDATTETEIVGVATIADLVDRALPGGLAGASDAEVKAAGSAIIEQLGEDSPLLNLSMASTRDAAGNWTVPAIAAPRCHSSPPTDS